ncbi:MAG: aminoacyl-tRNA hydrolase [Planctomycetota bacterium]|nr:aminoacyl-tRNA hydrolase [Planctomycetota bacterium]MDA1212530.1 aminoacyl-tRNA hydrolase [Planctomycetota bacterium]
MKLVVGLGNPGKKYEQTRHNVGYAVLTELSRSYQGGRPKTRFEADMVEIMIGSEKVMLAAPLTYMNLSGQSVALIVGFYQLNLDDVLVVCDDFNLDLGRLRLRGSGSSGGQKGLQNIITRCGSEKIARLRIGIGRPPQHMNTADFVLSRFHGEEQKEIERAIQDAAHGVELWVRQGLEPAMNSVNRPTDDPPDLEKSSETKL